MKTFRKTVHFALIALTIFLALTALAGCFQLLEGTYAPPLEMLNGSIFSDYTIPGLALGMIVGGSAIFAAVLLIRKSEFAILFATTAGVIIMFFEFVEILAIGSPAGIARTLQIFYFGLGTAIVVASLGTWFLDLQSNR
jgi:hypothetical protein